MFWKKIQPVVICLTVVFFLLHLYLLFGLAFIFIRYRQPSVSNDYVHYIAAARMVTAGQGRLLYSPSDFTYKLAHLSYPYPYPKLIYRPLSFVTLIYLPFSFLPPYYSLPLFWLVSLLCIFFSFLLLSPTRPLIPLLLALNSSFTPFIFDQGQPSTLCLLFLSLSLIFTLRRRWLLSGFLLAGLLIKPQFYLPLAAIIVPFLPRKFFLGNLIGIIFFLFLSALISGPSSVLNYPQYLLTTEVKSLGAHPEWYPSLGALISTYFPALPISKFVLTGFISVIILAVFHRLIRHYRLSLQPERLYSIAIFLSPFLAYHTTYYDLIIFLLPLILITTSAVTRHRPLYLLFYCFFYLFSPINHSPFITIPLTLSFPVFAFLLVRNRSFISPIPIPRQFSPPTASKL